MNRNAELKKDGLAMRECGPSVSVSEHMRLKRWVKRPEIDHLNDTELAAAAVEAIEWLTTIPQETITVTARNGCLHLEGRLSSLHQRSILEDVTRHLAGVKEVINSITIDAAQARGDVRAALR